MISIDCATISGVAIWADGTLASTHVVRPIGKSGRWRITGHPEPYASERAAWLELIRGHDLVVIERAYGPSPKAVDSLAFRRGYVTALAHGVGAQVVEVNTSGWRRVAAEAFGVSWPRKSAEDKALARSLVAQEYGCDVGDDEADAVLVGLWCIRTRAGGR